MRYRAYDTETFQQMLPKLPFDMHKYRRGVLCVFAGSERFTGAATLCADAALRTGAGYVGLVTTPSSAAVARVRLPSVPVFPCEARDGSLTKDALDLRDPFQCRADAFLIGPGLTVTDGTDKLLVKALKRLEQPCIVDADALNCIARFDADRVQTLERFCARGGSHRLVLTPHGGELDRLIGLCESLGLRSFERWVAPELENQREFDADIDEYANRTGDTGARAAIGKAVFVAKSLNCTLVAKGPLTIVAAPDRLTFSDLGTPALAKAGTGDVLAGIIGSLAAQGVEPFEASALGVYLHGLAGRKAQDAFGERGARAEDVLEAIAPSMKDFLGR